LLFIINNLQTRAATSSGFVNFQQPSPGRWMVRNRVAGIEIDYGSERL